MNLLDVLLSIVSIASGVVLGTVLTWIISYYMGKRLLPKLLKSLSENPENKDHSNFKEEFWIWRKTSRENTGQGGIEEKKL